MTQTGVLLCGHGSRDPEAIGEFELLAKALRSRLPGVDFATGYLEFARPTIRDGLAALAARGARRILAAPGMLFAASHVKNDLPWEVNSFAADNPGIEVRFGRDLGINPKLLRAAADRIAAALPNAGADLSDSLLIVVGRGTNDPDANSNIAKVARMLWEGMGFGWAETAFSGVAHPRVDTALSHSARLGFRRIVVFPYFLFTGILVKRIYDQSDTVARLFPGHRNRQRALSARPSRGARRILRTGRIVGRGFAGDELPALQIPHADHRLRSRCRGAAGRSSSSCSRHRSRRRTG